MEVWRDTVRQYLKIIGVDEKMKMELKEDHRKSDPYLNWETIDYKQT